MFLFHCMLRSPKEAKGLKENEKNTDPNRKEQNRERAFSHSINLFVSFLVFFGWNYETLIWEKGREGSEYGRTLCVLRILKRKMWYLVESTWSIWSREVELSEKEQAKPPFSNVSDSHTLTQKPNSMCTRWKENWEQEQLSFWWASLSQFLFHFAQRETRLRPSPMVSDPFFLVFFYFFTLFYFFDITIVLIFFGELFIYLYITWGEVMMVISLILMSL